MSADQLN